MRKLALIIVSIVIAAATASCQKSPEASFAELATAAQNGDDEAFLDGLTRASRDVVRGVLAAAPEARPRLLPTSLSGDVQVIASASEGDRALLRVSDGDGPPMPVVLLLEDGRWRLDLFETERAWGRIRLERELDPTSDLR